MAGNARWIGLRPMGLHNQALAAFSFKKPPTGGFFMEFKTFYDNVSV